MVTPDALAGDQFYKVGDWVTFAWNYTSLSVTPSAIDVLASCTANQATYTIAVNMSAKQTEVLWDTKNTPEGQAPFLTEKYKLLIYDADLSVSATPRPGYLGAFSGFTFGMYTPQPYVPYSGKSFPCPSSQVFITNAHRRIRMRKLPKRRSLTVRKDDTSSPAPHHRNYRRLSSLLYLRVRPVVKKKHKIVHALHHLNKDISKQKISITINGIPYASHLSIYIILSPTLLGIIYTTKPSIWDGWRFG